VGAPRSEGTLTEQLVALENVERVFHRGAVAVPALRRVNLEIKNGEFVAVVGPSGSGKTTLLSILGCLDRPTSGRYLLGGESVVEMDDVVLSRIRNRHIGFVFQSFHLIPQLSILENVETPLLYGDCPPGEIRERALRSLDRVGLSARVEHRPGELSGGEAQRAAVARALVTAPSLILADEPTGNLDSGTGEQIAALLASLHTQGTTVILVTHNLSLAQKAERRIALRDGVVDSDSGGGS
jgi:putative ABC transport system ATP-binding protein